jgi:hypothetical protein
MAEFKSQGKLKHWDDFSAANILIEIMVQIKYWHVFTIMGLQYFHGI